MSTGDGICSLCGLPLGPSSNPRVAVCAGHNSTSAVSLGAVKTASEAGDVEARCTCGAVMNKYAGMWRCVDPNCPSSVGWGERQDAAARESALRAENERLRTALERIATLYNSNLPPITTGYAENVAAGMRAIANDALRALDGREREDHCPVQPPPLAGLCHCDEPQRSVASGVDYCERCHGFLGGASHA